MLSPPYDQALKFQLFKYMDLTSSDLEWSFQKFSDQAMII